VKQVIATTGSHSMRLVDFDNDSDMDLFGANWQGQTVELYENQICPTSLDYWERHVIDLEKPWTSIFITSGDINGDNRVDIITGGWWYKNPGLVKEPWERIAIGSELKNMAMVFDFDQDGFLDILGTMGEGSASDSRFVWAHNNGNGLFTIFDNINSGEGDFLQGVAIDDQGSNDAMKVFLSWHAPNMGIQTLTLPPDPLNSMWTWDRISTISQDEALDIGDIDGDGDLDLLLGTIWLENSENGWVEHILHETEGLPYGSSDPDRNRLVDMNQDGRLDAVVGYEAISVPGKLAWYEQGVTATSIWTEHVIAMDVIGPMSLDAADMDKDGDIDVIVGEHNLGNPSKSRLLIFENLDGTGTAWQEHLVYTGDEHHDGAIVVDIDSDGDLDIISIGWGHNKVLLFENKMSNCVHTPRNIVSSKVFLPVLGFSVFRD
jgi:hypothetical protein